MNKIAIELKWGLIFFGATLLWMVLEKAAGLHGSHIDKHAVYTNFFAVPAILIYICALRDKRELYYHGVMSWKQGFVSGIVLTAFIALFSPLAQVITHKIITPDYFGNAITFAVASGKMSEEAAAAYFNLNSYILQSVVGAAVMGLLTTTIVALFVKKRPAVEA